MVRVRSLDWITEDRDQTDVRKLLPDPQRHRVLVRWHGRKNWPVHPVVHGPEHVMRGRRSPPAFRIGKRKVLTQVGIPPAAMSSFVAEVRCFLACGHADLRVPSQIFMQRRGSGLLRSDHDEIELALLRLLVSHSPHQNRMATRDRDPSRALRLIRARRWRRGVLGAEDFIGTPPASPEERGRTAEAVHH